MIDVSKIAYKIYLLRENGEQLDITHISSEPTWEENEGELAMRVSLSIANVVRNGIRMSSIAKPNCYIIVTSEVVGKTEEVARGKINEWSPQRSGNTDVLDLIGYDELYDLQASQDNRYISAGVGTKTAVMSIFNDWGIPVSNYQGPNVPNAKTAYKNEYLSDIIIKLLKTAHEHGAVDCMVRAVKGKVQVLPKASNTLVYCFEEDQNLAMTKYKISTSNMVTVVKVVATEDSDGRQAVEAIINGKTQYGKRQKIYVRDADDTLATAKAAAQEILDKDGDPEETMSVKAPDIPTIRKGDRVKITSRVYTGYMVVLSITHDAASKSMTMGLEKYNEAKLSGRGIIQETKAKPTTYKAGDIVDFNGGYHYVSSTAGSPTGGSRKAGKAKITYTNIGSKHPYHLVGGAYNGSVTGNCNVYGWVDANTFS